MPYYWTSIPSSPPKQRRNEVAEICNRHRGRLCENEIFYDGQGGAYALIQLPEDEGEQRAICDELRALHCLGLVDADEKEQGKRPPQSRGGP